MKSIERNQESKQAYYRRKEKNRTEQNKSTTHETHMQREIDITYSHSPTPTYAHTLAIQIEAQNHTSNTHPLVPSVEA